MSHRFIAHVLSSAAVLIGPNSELFGSKLHTTNTEAPTVISWGFFLSICASSRVLLGVPAEESKVLIVLPSGVHEGTVPRVN